MGIQYDRQGSIKEAMFRRRWHHIAVLAAKLPVDETFKDRMRRGMQVLESLEVPFTASSMGCQASRGNGLLKQRDIGPDGIAWATTRPWARSCFRAPKVIARSSMSRRQVRLTSRVGSGGTVY